MVAALRAGEGAGILSAHTDEHNRAVRRAMAALRAAGRAPTWRSSTSARCVVAPPVVARAAPACAAATAPPRVDGGSIGVPRSLSDANDESARRRGALWRTSWRRAPRARGCRRRRSARCCSVLDGGDAKTAVRVYSDHLEASAAALEGVDGGDGGSWRRRQMGSGEREAQGMLATTLACCAGAGDADAASRVVEIARAHGVVVGADANNALVNALSRGARREEATARARRVLAEEAEERSSGFQPHADVVAVNTALHALSRGPRPLEAADTFPPPSARRAAVATTTAAAAAATHRYYHPRDRGQRPRARATPGVPSAYCMPPSALGSPRPAITFTSPHACRRDRRAADGREPTRHTN